MPAPEDRKYEQFFDSRVTDEERDLIHSAGERLAEYVYSEIMKLSMKRGFTSKLDPEWEEFVEKVKASTILWLDSLIP
jgi:hypothetical protein